MIKIQVNLTPNQKLVILITGFLLVVTAISIWVVVPVVKDIQNLNQRIYEQRLALEKRYVQRFSVRRIIKNFSEINESMDKALSMFLEENSEINFLTSLEQAADENNVSLQIYLSPQEDGLDEEKQKLELTLTVKGDFSKVLGFMNTIEKFEKYILLNSVSLIQKPEDKDGVINASLKGHVYKNINL